jgi:uncharacterized membrane protein YhaH (DUF805 family)
MSFDTLFVNPAGRTARGPFVGALIVLLAAVAFYAFLVTGRTAQFCMVVLILPGVVLHARRLHDMGLTAWLLIAPGALLLATAWLHLYDAESQLVTPVSAVALVVTAGFALWGVLGKGQAGANRFGEPSPA